MVGRHPFERRVPLGALLVASFLVVAISHLEMGTAKSIEMVYGFSLLGALANGIDLFAAMTAYRRRRLRRFR